MKRRIPLEQLTPGMHLLGLDQSWFKSPLWFHRGLVKSNAEIWKLKQAGVQEVTIDTEQGHDVQDPPGEAVMPVAQGPGECSSTCTIEPHDENEKKAERDEAGGQQKEEWFNLDAFEEEMHLAQEVRAQAIHSIKRVFEGIKTGVALESGSLRDVTQTLFESIKARDGCVLADAQLQRMMQYDASLFSHAVDVCVLALVIGHRSQLSDQQLQDLAIGALLHDVGQLRLPRNLLFKKGAFSQEERNLYLTHPKLGASILDKADDIAEASRRIVLEHHERINGAGYPWGRKGTTISPLAQLVGLVDYYDALVSKRGGRPPLPPALAVRRLYQLGIDGQFAMEWVEALVQCLGLYPVGSLVELSTGERGWVVGINQADHMLPRVRLVWSKTRKKLISIRIEDLAEYCVNHKPVRVVRILNPFEEGIQDDLCFLPQMEHASS